MRVENKKLYKKLTEPIHTIELFRFIAERKGEMYGIHYFDDRVLYWDCVNDLYLGAVISFVCMSIGIGMLIRYKRIYEKK